MLRLPNVRHAVTVLPSGGGVFHWNIFGHHLFAQTYIHENEDHPFIFLAPLRPMPSAEEKRSVSGFRYHQIIVVGFFLC
jgi:hypothetical protein